MGGLLAAGALSPEDEARVEAGGIDGLRVRLRAKYWDFLTMNDPAYSFEFRRWAYAKVRVRDINDCGGWWHMSFKANDIRSKKRTHKFLYPNRRARRAWSVWTRELKRLGIYDKDRTDMANVVAHEYARVKWFLGPGGESSWRRTRQMFARLDAEKAAA